MKASARRVAEALDAAGVQTTVSECAQSTRTAEQAAAAVGTTVGRIVKSLVFMAGQEPLLALVSGANRLDTERLAAHLGRPVRRASADEVRDATGFGIGGVPPVGHGRPLAVVIDRDLVAYDVVYAAAGTPHAVFPITPSDLQRITGGVVVDLAARSSRP
jgi:prolyl-tRNA editing enzyme YbaK/EbsC (Cys-tRNA(Pro) deacylase)